MHNPISASTTAKPNAPEGVESIMDASKAAVE